MGGRAGGEGELEACRQAQVGGGCVWLRGGVHLLSRVRCSPCIDAGLDPTYLPTRISVCAWPQVGAWVPADSLELTVCDGIYTRMGASDNILLGRR